MKYIIDSILNYVKKENTNYAILLNGKWGSGKTYFWKNTLRNKIEELEIKGKKQRAVYVSLYGISSIEEINKRIVLDNLSRKDELFGKFDGSRRGDKLTELAKMTVDVVKNLEIPVLEQTVDTNVDYGNFLDFTNIVLCFDDLERANIGISDILGYINNFVEHDGIKAIIISNEDEISNRLINHNIEFKMLLSSIVLDKEGIFIDNNVVRKKENVSTKELVTDKLLSLFDKTNEYERIKEKLIGKTLTFIPNYPILIEEVVNQVSNESLKLFLIENINDIIKTFKDSGTENTRILKQALDDFELVYLKFEEKYSNLGTSVLTSILKFILAASFEIKSGVKDNKNLEQIKSNDDFLSAISLAKMLNKDVKGYLELFKEKYYYGTFNVFNSLIYFKFAELLVRKGIFNIEIFEQEMNTIKDKLVDKTPLHIKFIKNGYWVLSDEEFFEVEQQTYQKLMNGEVHFVLYFRAFILYRHLVGKGLVKKKTDVLKNELIIGMNIAAEKAEYYDNMDMFFIGSEIKPDDHDLIIFKERILEINRGLKDKQQEREVQLLMEIMVSDFHKFLVDMQEKYFYLPIFSYYDSEKLFKKILALSNSNTLSMIQLLERRYELLEECSKLYLDLENLKALRNKITEYIDGKNITLKISLLGDLSDSIKKISDKMSQ